MQLAVFWTFLGPMAYQPVIIESQAARDAAFIGYSFAPGQQVENFEYSLSVTEEHVSERSHLSSH